MKTRFVLMAVLLFSGIVTAQAEEDYFSTPPGSAIFPSQYERPHSGLRAGALRLTQAEVDALLDSRPRQKFSLPSFDAFTDNEPGSLEFQRVSLFAKGSRVQVVSDEGTSVVPHDSRHIFIATGEHLGIGLAVNPSTGETTGFATHFGQKLKIGGNFASQLDFSHIKPEEEGTASCETEMDNQPADILAELEQPVPLSSSASKAGETISYQAVVAIETDTEWLTNKFSNNTANAQLWITDLFLAMNVYYERDIETHLLIGDTTLRIGSDPYSESGDRLEQLHEFGEYWMENMDHVDRQFASMFSGRDIGSNGFSGVAWLGKYCETGYWGTVNDQQKVVGSYNYNAIGSSFSAGTTALFVGHELGHNLGSSHTHCYDPPVDQCFNGESNCYSGTPACPASGQGTVMSYCHVNGSNGADCGISNAEFHPTVQNLLESRLSTQLTQGCIAPYTVSDFIFTTGFEPGL